MATTSPVSSHSTADDCRIIIIACSAVVRGQMDRTLENVPGFHIVAAVASGQCGSNPGICPVLLPLSKIGPRAKKFATRTGA